MGAVATLDRLLRRDRLMMVAGLVATIALAWLYLLRIASQMTAMSVEMQMHAAMGMADMRAWGLTDWVGLFAMWSVMMTAMMLPSAAPVVLLVLGVYRRRKDPAARLSSTFFVAGYLIVWMAFSVAVSLLQIVLHRRAVLAADMRLTPTMVSAVVLLLAGIYQWLPIKNSCLVRCRSPLGFLTHYWREGLLGGLEMGIRHGTLCVGCCWLLMALLFVVGIMNMMWVAVLTAIVFIEKLVPRGDLFGRVAGIGLAAWGTYLLTA